ALGVDRINRNLGVHESVSSLGDVRPVITVAGIAEAVAINVERGINAEGKGLREPDQVLSPWVAREASGDGLQCGQSIGDAYIRLCVGAFLLERYDGLLHLLRQRIEHARSVERHFAIAAGVVEQRRTLGIQALYQALQNI